MPPTISVITVVYNGVAEIAATIESVINQTYSNVEYLIIDGASKDGTIEVIKKYESQISYWNSEPDKGLYDAMNKGLKKATGDFVLFMNTGDRFFDHQVLEKIFQQADNETDILYGEVMLVNEKRRHLGTRSDLTTQKTPKNLNWKSLKMGMVVSHQAFMPRQTIAPFYIPNNLSADIDWVIACLKKSRKTVNTNTIVAEFLTGGVSKQRHQKAMKDRYQVLKKHYGVLPNLWHHGLIVLRAIWFKISRLGKTTYS